MDIDTVNKHPVADVGIDADNLCPDTALPCAEVNEPGSFRGYRCFAPAFVGAEFLRFKKLRPKATKYQIGI